MSANDQVFLFPLESLPLEQFCKITGHTPSQIRTRICRSQWAEGEHYYKDPMGHIHIILRGYERWVRSGVASKLAEAA